MSRNEEVKRRAARLLEDGAIFAFGLSERQHGADIYSTEMTLTPVGEGRYVANGRKYYIGNGNTAAIVSTFGKLGGRGTGARDYVFFAVDSPRERYELVKNVVASQNFVPEYALHDYPITEGDILAKGQDAWDNALNTVNVGKFNLGWATIGICTHAFYEAIRHAANRRLYGMHVTDMSHVRRMFVDAYARLVAMKLFALRAADYMRSASSQDRRYLLYNPMVKMKVTTQGEDVINLLWDAIAAKGFEKDMYFEQAAVDIRALPKLEGTVHVNIALIVKFMPSFFFAPEELLEVPRRDDAANDDFLFAQVRPGGSDRSGSTTTARAWRTESAQRRAAGRADRGFPGDARHRAARRGAAKGRRLPARGRRALRACRLRATHPRERPHLRRRPGTGRPDLRGPGARLLASRRRAPRAPCEQRAADGVRAADDPQADRGRRAVPSGLERDGTAAQGRV